MAESYGNYQYNDYYIEHRSEQDGCAKFCDFYNKYFLPLFALGIIIFSIVDAIVQIKYEYFDLYNTIASILVVPLAIAFLSFLLRGKKLKNKGLAIASSIIAPSGGILRFVGYVLSLLDEERLDEPIENLLVGWGLGELPCMMLLVFLTCYS